MENSNINNYILITIFSYCQTSKTEGNIQQKAQKRIELLTTGYVANWLAGYMHILIITSCR